MAGALFLTAAASPASAQNQIVARYFGAAKGYSPCLVPVVATSNGASFNTRCSFPVPPGSSSLDVSIFDDHWGGSLPGSWATLDSGGQEEVTGDFCGNAQGIGLDASVARVAVWVEADNGANSVCNASEVGTSGTVTAVFS
jgi:hypothetical protein